MTIDPFAPRMTKTPKKRGLVLRENNCRQTHVNPDLEPKIMTGYAAGKAVAQSAEEFAAFTEQGVAMLSSVLRSPRAVRVNIEIMRAFVRLRQMLRQNADLARKLATLEKKYDAQFKVVLDAIRGLMAPPEPKQKRIGFRPERP